MYAIKGVGLIFLLLASIVSAHPGRKDSQGGHHQRATGTCHFHDGALVGQTFASKAAGSAALAGGHIGSPEAQSSIASAMLAGDLAKYFTSTIHKS